jgi:hypothetical protein
MIKIIKTKRKATKPIKEPKLSRTHAPTDLSPVDWQRALRRQFGREQLFDLECLGTEPFFSDFRVGNPQFTSHYRVAIRGLKPGDNFCSCPDYATNELGTCKHIEFTLAQLEKRAVPRLHSRTAIIRRFPNCICVTTMAEQSIFVPGRIVRLQ